MDALPIKEQTNLPFAAKNGNMHACGHDMHCAILLGVSKILKKYEDKLKIKVKLIYTVIMIQVRLFLSVNSIITNAFTQLIMNTAKKGT